MRRPLGTRGAQGTGGRSPTDRVPARAFSWLLLFARAKRSNSLLRSRSESSASSTCFHALPLDFPAIGRARFSWSTLWPALGSPSNGGSGIRDFRSPSGREPPSLLVQRNVAQRGAFQQPDGWSTRPCLSAFRNSGTPGPLYRRDFSTRPSCDAAGAGAVASRRQPAHRGEAVLHLFPVRPCLVEKRRARPLRSRVRGRRRAAPARPAGRSSASPISAEPMHVAPAVSCPSAPSLRKGPGSQMQRKKQNHGNANNNRRPAEVPKEEEPLARPFPLHRAMYPIRPDRPRPPAALPSSAPPTGGTRTTPAPARRR